MRIEISKKNLKELQKIADSKKKTLNQIINLALKEYVMLEKALEEVLRFGGSI